MGELTQLLSWRGAALELVAARKQDDVGFCHGEAYPASFVADEPGRLSVGTLEYAGFGPRLYDVATVRWVLELHARDRAEDTFAAFLAAYRARPALDFDDSLLRAWVAIRHLWAFRLGWLMAREQGLAVLAGDADQLERRARFASHWTLGSKPPGSA